jgi:N-carbamoylputrescine amidase
MMREIVAAAVQMACGPDRDANMAKAERLVRKAAERGANLVLLPELFETPYFCKDQSVEHFRLAHSYEGHPTLARMSRLAGELGLVMPVSFFERCNNAYFNSIAIIDADGQILGVYRKSHIPDGPGYQEKFYFNQGDTGFRVWRTKVGTIGVAICWDQWFPECARSMALMGAEVILYPTAIGSEPHDPELDSRDHWRRVMQGHAAANIVPVVAANRYGVEVGRSCTINFYGSSFVTDERGGFLATADRAEEKIVTARIDPEACAVARAGWGLFRDRRPDLYLPVLTLDGYDQSA